MTSLADHDAAIRSVLARIAQLADTSTDLDDYLALFTEDAVWGMPANPALDLPANQKHGRAEIRAGAEERRASGIQGPGTNTRHILTTTSVNVESDDRATARSYYLFVDSTTTTPTIRTVGQYDDVLVRGAQGWQLARRDITIG
jgi:3-phenylpropionate/cinnamic acid dioxygenase small subunit